MEKEKISTHPFVEKNDVMYTSWGKIVAKRISIEIHIRELGVIEVFGWITCKRNENNTITIDGTEFESAVIVINGELKI